MILRINSQSAEPIYKQLHNQIVIGIANGQLATGEQLPSVRGMAADLGINKITVNKVYSILEEEGYITVDYRKRAVVAEKLAAPRTFEEQLRKTLILAAAEARVARLCEDEFLTLCRQCYREASPQSVAD